jgi:hypothetical protein
MSRPATPTAHDELVRKIRECCARIAEDGNTAGLVTGIHLMVISILIRLAEMIELWKAGQLPQPSQTATRPNSNQNPNRARRTHNAPTPSAQAPRARTKRHRACTPTPCAPRIPQIARPPPGFGAKNSGNPLRKRASILLRFSNQKTRIFFL